LILSKDVTSSQLMCCVHEVFIHIQQRPPSQFSAPLPGDMSIEELLEKYKGAYASDFEAPSASGSKASSDSEVSGDEEVESSRCRR